MIRGFTLIELLIVLTLLGLTMSLVGPLTFKQYERTQLLKEREQLYRILENTAYTSLVERTPVVIRLMGSELSLQPHQAEPVIVIFDYLTFPEQEIKVNAHGFWLSSQLYLIQQDKRYAVTLSHDAVVTQNSRQPSGSGGRTLQYHAILEESLP